MNANHLIYDRMQFILQQYDHPSVLTGLKYASQHTQNADLQSKKHTTMPGHAVLKKTAQPLMAEDDIMAALQNEIINGNSDHQQWKCAGIGMQSIVELSELCSTVFAQFGLDPSVFYTSVYHGNAGVWYAVLFALDTQFMMRTFQDQQNCVITLKQQMNCELDTHYTTHKYRQYGYSKSDMHRALLNEDSYHAFMGHYLSDFIKINIAVLTTNGYYWLGRYDPTRVTVAMHHEGTEWSSVVHADGTSHLFTHTAWLDPLTHVDYLDSSKHHMNLTLNKATLALLKREIKNMKIRDLQDKATELELLVHDGDGRKKLKKDLQEEVYVQMTGCESMS
jgi:hypothetical protein